jgi:hypothetical protein
MTDQEIARLTGSLIAAAAASVPTLLDLDERFQNIGTWSNRARIQIWWWGFVLLNAALAGGLYLAVESNDALKAQPTWMRGIVVGLGFLSLMRQKFGTVSGQAVGIENLYDRIKRVFYRRLELAEQQVIAATVTRLLQNSDLARIRQRARVWAATLPAEQKDRWLEWLQRVEADTVSDSEKCVVLATAIAFDFQRA